MSLLPRQMIYDLQSAALRAGLDRQALLSGLDAGFVASLRRANNDAAQILEDLSALNEIVELADKSVPLRWWLQNALGMASMRPEREVFLRALESLSPAPLPQQTPLPSPQRSSREPDPVKILFLGTNPSGLTQRALDHEIREISERLRGAKLGDRFKLVQAWAVQVDDLQQSLLEHQPTIVHFSGHGNKDGQIMVEDRHGKAFAVSPRGLAGMFKALRDNIRCVVLNACGSQGQAEAIAQSIDCVMWMAADLTDAGAIVFSGALYQALGYGRTIQTAFDLALTQLTLEGLSDAELPMLSCKPGIRAEDVRLLEAPT
jgi:hypothetical protein